MIRIMRSMCLTSNGYMPFDAPIKLPRKVQYHSDFLHPITTFGLSLLNVPVHTWKPLIIDLVCVTCPLLARLRLNLWLLQSNTVLQLDSIVSIQVLPVTHLHGLLSSNNLMGPMQIGMMMKGIWSHHLRHHSTVPDKLPMLFCLQSFSCCSCWRSSCFVWTRRDPVSWTPLCSSFWSTTFTVCIYALQCQTTWF